ncbi:Mitochondrial import inner membrane translocase subunit tim50 [Sphaceloma murrayae]|uniref:Mitochondrial import inner membrane translocase subunit tim50 n=1 Tax=Sphaceloma murrayae TaxID=2082308 RepID=A0A2K1QQY4_9PEZI|nr:Mitochondrial import inner membrane translocase subunit tim50 [Sphaceloma murrayae]
MEAIRKNGSKAATHQSKARGRAIKHTSSLEVSPGPSDGKLPPVPASNTIVDPHGVMIISESGDLVLEFKHEQDTLHTAKFRVKSSCVREKSSYFRLLLDPTGFEEGRRVADGISKFADQNVSEVSSALLPQITILDIGHVSPVKSITLLLADFLCLLHDQPVSNPHPPLTNLANLTVVADRFDALEPLRSYVHSSRLFSALDARNTKVKTPLTEDRLRQRALVGIYLDHPPWLLSSTQRLVQRCSVLASTASVAAWHDLPFSLEDELHFRRCALLDTIQSLQSYFLAQYTSRTRQCRLGYDSSAACDSFQLGEMVKFFTRSGTLSLSGGLVSHPPLSAGDQSSAHMKEDFEPPMHEGDLLDLLEKLRMCPEYQIDSNHHHCGIRIRLLPALAVIEKAIEGAGICADCWKDWRPEYSWREAKRPLIWRREERAVMTGLDPARRCLNRHLGMRDMCLARDRVWEKPRDDTHDGAGWITSRKQ